jgi:hypothetical protein
MPIGFSTGSIALGDVSLGLNIATHSRTNAVELSALREEELDPLLRSLDRLQDKLRTFVYISFHAPSKREKLSEAEVVSKLKQVADRGWAIIVHPDIIKDFSLWRALGSAVCIENMDKRKRIGRTAAQLKSVFDELPEATFCFDIGHARQVDPTMQEAESLLQMFGKRIRQIHMSYVNSQSYHERLNYESIIAYQRVSQWLDRSIPIILETPVRKSEIDEELASADMVFGCMDDSGDVEGQSVTQEKTELLVDVIRAWSEVRIAGSTAESGVQSKCGFRIDNWNKAKAEMRALLSQRAQVGKTITYADLMCNVRTVRLDPQSNAMAAMLGEISEEEDAAGRGLLSVIVVHTSGDMQPGPGFFELAKKRGRDTSDIVECWVGELRNVYAVWDVSRWRKT